MEPQVSLTGFTVNVPLQFAVKPLDVPQVAVAFMALYVPDAGLLQFGAFADQLMPVAVSPFLQVKTGGVIATPETPLAGMEPQASVTGAELEELVVKEELDGTTELLLGTTLEELGGAEELDGSTEPLLGTSESELGRSDELELMAIPGQDSTNCPNTRQVSARVSVQMPPPKSQSTEPLNEELL